MVQRTKNITWSGGFAVALLTAAAIAGAACDTRDASAESAGSSTATAESRAAQVERGRYLVTVNVCNDCHTPLKMGPNGPEPDMSRMLSGHPEQYTITEAAAPPSGQWQNGFTMAPTMTAFSGPWGVSFTANLTPDQNTGLGIWTEDMFITALRTGKHFGVSRPILPPMPWQYFGKMTDDDLKAIFAYLRTIKPISNHVPDPIPPASTTH
jgi:cytochrome c553